MSCVFVFYVQSAAVIRMLEHSIGYDTFRQGLAVCQVLSFLFLYTKIHLLSFCPFSSPNERQ